MLRLPSWRIVNSGWLGAMNYGVIVANEVDSQLMTTAAGSGTAVEAEIAAG